MKNIVAQSDLTVNFPPPLTRSQLRVELRIQSAELKRQTEEYQDLKEQLRTAKPPYRPEYVKQMLEQYEPLPEQRRIVRRLERELAAKAR